MTRIPRQSGSALLIALVAVALATLLAVGLVERAQRDLARTSALITNERSWQFALGMEALADRLLARALAEGVDPASLAGTWTEPFAVPGGEVQARLLDQHGRFNLNALGHPDRLLAAQAEQVLVRLLEQLGLPREMAVELREWQLDAGTEGLGRGSEFWYEAQDPPYRRAGLPLVHVSELRWLRGVDPAAFQRLSPHVTVLPGPQLTINVNSTSPELLSALVEGLELEQARRLLADGPFGDIQQLRTHPLLVDRLSPEHMALLVVRSGWFVVHSRVVLDGVARDYHRLMDRGGSGYDFRWFSQGPP